MSRPSEFKPEYCGRVVDLGAQGASKHEMALELGCVYQTFLNWQQAHPEFMDAVKTAESASQGWWEREGRKATFGAMQGFNATSFIFNMKNRFPGDWRDKHEVAATGGLTITISSDDAKL